MIVDVSTPISRRASRSWKKAKEKHLPIDSEISAISPGPSRRTSELEGSLNKIVAYHQFKNTTPTLASVQTLLQSYAPNVPKRTITPKRLLEVVCVHFDVPMDEILGKSREQRLAIPVRVAMYLLREEAKCSFSAIGTWAAATTPQPCTPAARSRIFLGKRAAQATSSLIREKLYTAS